MLSRFQSPAGAEFGGLKDHLHISVIGILSEYRKTNIHGGTFLRYWGALFRVPILIALNKRGIPVFLWSFGP